MKNIVISFSGGRTSAYMAYKILTEPEFKGRDLHFVFANTGKEREETLVFIERCSRHFGVEIDWIEAEINPKKGNGCDVRRVCFETASRNGEPFDAMVKKFGIPNIDSPHCTRELKTRPIKKWADRKFGHNKYVQAIGFRADEKTRAGDRRQKIYPLIETWPTNEWMVRKFWSAMPFDLGLKDYEGNCDLCWKKSLAKRITILHENPNAAKQWAEWEASGEYIFDRDGIPIPKLVEIAGRFNFRRQRDKHEVSCLMPELFDIDIHRESKCHCG